MKTTALQTPERRYTPTHQNRKKGSGAGRRCARYPKEIKAIMYGLLLRLMSTDETCEEDKAWAKKGLTHQLVLDTLERYAPGWVRRRYVETGQLPLGIARNVINRGYRFWNWERKTARAAGYASEARRGRRSKEHPKEWADFDLYVPLIERVQKGL